MYLAMYMHSTIRIFLDKKAEEKVFLYVCSIRYTFSSNHNIHKSSCGLCFCAPDPLIDRFY